MSDPRLEALRARLSGTRQAAAGTIAIAVQVGARFLAWSGKDTMTPEDVDRYFAHRRGTGISERTLKNEFYQLRTLFEANRIDWPFDKGDTPRPKDKPSQPTFTPEQLAVLIMAQPAYTPVERLYLAISTTWACRCSALAMLKKRDWDGESLIIPGVHGSETVKHLIPECLKPLFDGYRIKPRRTSTLNEMFHRILDKAELHPGIGYAWHSIRRAVNTMVLHALPLERRIRWRYSTGWTKEHIGREEYGSAMAGYYDHPEILHEDEPFWNDRQIYEYHPLLKLWEKTLKEAPPVIAVTSESPPVQTLELSESANIIPEIIPVSTVPEQIKESPLDKLIRELKGG